MIWQRRCVDGELNRSNNKMIVSRAEFVRRRRRKVHGRDVMKLTRDKKNSQQDSK